MSARTTKIQKRETRRILKGYLTDITDYLKPKEKWVPWWLYQWCQRRVIHMEKIDPIAKLKGGKGVRSQD